VNRTATSAPPPSEVLDAFALDPVSLAPAGSGLINQTWFAHDSGGEPRVLQRVNSVFRPEIHNDIEVVTRHLVAKGLETPVLVRSRRGGLWLEHDAAVWRLMTYIDGITYEALSSAAQAREAGRALARFHRALEDLEHTFSSARLGVHDTDRHLRMLREALVEHTGHSSYGTIAALAAEVLELATEIAPLPSVPDRIVHGDPKVSNILFARAGARALCLIDLDTLAHMPVEFELGDAFRSWCNPKTEDASSATFALPLFEAALEGYAEQSAGLLGRDEWSSIQAATYRIAVELAARFCADALHERYFAWDASRYASSSAHNRARTRGQLNLARTIRDQRGAIETIVTRAFSR
jgi:Ser/Thr protein kinase RdoA (MazF antagonist)